MAGRRGVSPYRDDSYEDDYSEDFDDDDLNDTGNKRYKTRSPVLRTDRSNRGRGRGRASQLNTSRSTMEPKFDNVAKRVLSARRLKINELMNQNNELKQQIIDIRDENKLLKKTQRRQDKALQRFEDQENDLPSLIQRQNNEVRSLKDQIRKWREKYEKTDRYLRDAEDELEKVKSKLKKLKSLADEKDLPERSDLNRKLNQSELELEARDVKIKELERHIKHLEKNHRHELGIERARQKEVNNQLLQLRDENDKLHTNVKEKEKEIQMKNIYANRMVKPPHRLPNSYNGTPHDSPPPRRRRPSEGDGITPRERAKQMEMKRREEMRKQRELKQRKLKRDNYLGNQTTTGQGTDNLPPIPHGEITPRSQQNVEHAEKLKRDQEMRRQREEDEENERRRRREEERREIEAKERLLNEQAEREEEERRLKSDRVRMKREAEDRERRERERQEVEERTRREKREREERERRERERKEQEKRALEERRRIEEDETFQAERKKKDEILQKLREIDEGGQKNKDKNIDDPFFVTEAKEDTEESISSKKSYNFSKQIQNMHKGKPARTSFNASVAGTSDKRKAKKETDSVEIGGYNPSFGGRFGSETSGSFKPKSFSLFDDDDEHKPNTTTAKPANKAKLLEDLFGSKDVGKSSNDDDIFAPKPQAKRSDGAANRNAFPWDNDSNFKSSTSTVKPKRENSSTLFGGGNAFVNDEDLHITQHTNASLPRRQKQSTTTFHTRPTVNAVDQFDDDIEEVIL